MRQLLLIVVLSCGCGAAPSVEMTSRAHAVSVTKGDPSEDCRELGPIEAVHGNGVGLYGKRGDYENAYNTFRNAAAQRGATHVRIDDQIAPHSEGGGNNQYFDNRYIIRGVAFRCDGSTVAPATSSPEPPEPREPTETVALKPSSECLSNEVYDRRLNLTKKQHAGGTLSDDRYQATMRELAEQRCEPLPEAPDGPPAESADERLLKLKQLHEKGLITDEEYTTKRAEILQEL